MSDTIPVSSGETVDYFFLNNCMGSFYRGILDWFADEYYGHFRQRVIGTYEKAIEYFKKKSDQGMESDRQRIPCICLDPSFDFEPDDRAGKFLWQYQNLAPGLGYVLFNHEKGLEQQDLLLTSVYTRYKGSFDLIMWLGSFYELLDMRIRMYQFTGGIGRIIRPTLINSFITIPKEIIDYKIQNADGTESSIDWSGTPVINKKIDSISKYQYCLPITLSPTMSLTGISDSSNKYGGDALSEAKMTCSFSYEINLPTYIRFLPYVDFPHTGSLSINVGVSYAKSRYSNKIPIDYFPSTSEPLNDDESDPVWACRRCMSRGTTLKERAIYEFQSTDTNPVIFPNPFVGHKDYDLTIVASYNGLILPRDNWQYSEDGSTITVNIDPIEGDLIELYRYGI